MLEHNPHGPPPPPIPPRQNNGRPVGQPVHLLPQSIPPHSLPLSSTNNGNLNTPLPPSVSTRPPQLPKNPPPKLLASSAVTAAIAAKASAYDKLRKDTLLHGVEGTSVVSPPPPPIPPPRPIATSSTTNITSFPIPSAPVSSSNPPLPPPILPTIRPVSPLKPPSININSKRRGSLPTAQTGARSPSHHNPSLSCVIDQTSASNTPLQLSAAALCTTTAYNLVEQIGKGSFGIVYRAENVHNHDQVAIKIVSLEDEQKSSVGENFQKPRTDVFEEKWREVLMSCQLHHLNILRFTHCFIHKSQLWMVQPLMEGGSCKSLLDLVSPKGIKDETLIASIIYPIVLALAYLHEQGIVHMDVKADNILLGDDGHVALADFGVSQDLMKPVEDSDDEDSNVSTTNGDSGIKEFHSHVTMSRPKRKKRQGLAFAGTPCWMSPEVICQTELLTTAETDKTKEENPFRVSRRSSTSSSAHISNSRSRSRKKCDRNSDANSIIVDDELDVPMPGIWGSPAQVSPAQPSSPTSRPRQSSKSMSQTQAMISAKADVWSLGITVLELAFGKPPHANADPSTLRQILSSSPSPTAALYDDPSYSFSASFHQFIAQCLVKEPRMRCSAATLLKHRFLKKAKKESAYMRNIVADLLKKRHELKMAEQRLRKDQARKERNERKRSDIPGIVFN